jgi:hypothetical protein
LGSLGSGALTAASTLLVTVFSAVVGVVIAREFGRTGETDGFFAAYGVFIVIVLAAQAVRIAVLPALARAQEEGRLAGEWAGFALAMAVVAVPLVLVAELAADQLATLLTGDGSELARDTAADALRWMVPAAVGHLFAGLAASGLAALDDYATAAFGYAAGSTAGLALILTRVEPDGIVAVAWGMMLNAVIALLVPLAGLAVRAVRARMPATAVRPTGRPLRSRLGAFVTAAVLPLALQMLYVVCLPFAGREGEGATTSFVYAYLAASALVSVTAGSLGLVTSVPLARADLSAAGVTRHVVAASWIALAVVGAAAGVFALAGGDVVEAVLGGAYGGDVGADLGRLVVGLSAWMIAAVGVSVTFPLAFVAGRTRALPWMAAGALALQVPLAWVGSTLLDLDGLVLALAAATWVVLGAMLGNLHVLEPALRGLVVAAAVVAAIAVGAFVPAGLLFQAGLAAALGLALYLLVLATVRPRGLRAAWTYLRALS